jgi:hypothetical protein
MIGIIKSVTHVSALENLALSGFGHKRNKKFVISVMNYSGNKEH